MVQFYDYDLQTDGPTQATDYLASIVFNLLQQLTKGPADTMTRSMPHDDGFETPECYANNLDGQSDRR